MAPAELGKLRHDLIDAARAIIGAGGLLSEAADMEGYLTDWRRRYTGEALAVALPSGAGQVSELVKACRALGVAIVPQGGNTGFAGGAVPTKDRPALLLNLSRMNRIREVDVANNSFVAEAGCVLEMVRQEAQNAGKLFPLLLGSAGSCQVGGLVATNAGGTGVLRYGNMRDLVLGLEVVLPDGSLWNGLKSLRKDNSGYDLKQFFIGAEGTLGIITAASLKLFPLPDKSASAMVAVPDVQAAVDLLHMFMERTGRRVEAFELMSRGQIESILANTHVRQSPMELTTPWFILIELADSSVDFEPERLFETILGEALERGLVSDAVIAGDSTKANKIWELRHSASEANVRKGFSVANDTSVPISKLPEFLETVERRLLGEIEQADVFHVGHIGDGNIHVVVVLDRERYADQSDREQAAALANHIVHGVSVDLGGSISAEHGIGMMHAAELEQFKSALDLRMMRAIKTAFDPENLMNPGKVLRR
ncbi:FAD-binding oxidoreductase [Bosea sp. (in: a-proteobacteria)]|jgi:FAD/FMN-containing dehydrogenase|uniref:FAD-binding oxidoreductase n=1 Tax=Bosea sp. (in: a-proteobacteria) TaxID=1871050 RepID=UPI002DDDA117|nr:FAD-binding oxidoreductase [Bosea sp. (in: a-proteobacteria)]HEV2510273.1 FAD-binding oxidoreductase [Bosea sp. (in: a-proteobacteria)]